MVIKFGKHKGKMLSDMEKSELADYGNYMAGLPDIKGKVKEFVEKVPYFLNHGEEEDVPMFDQTR